MRITNNMIVGNTKTNINSNKVLVDKYNTQMTTQKKISKASENPVVAIRSLRLSTSLTHLDQFSTNIGDADSWLDVTFTALNNMKTILTDIRTQCVNGSTDTLTDSDRNTILKQLTAMASQVYTEGNADYAGRTVFTGYRTSSSLTFNQDEKDTSYEITQNFSYKDFQEKRYYSGNVEVPTTVSPGDEKCDVEISERSYNRLRLGYGSIDDVNSIDATLADGTELTIDFENGTIGSYREFVDEDDNTIIYEDDSYGVVNTYDTYLDWENATGGQIVDANEIVVIRETGEVIIGDDVYKDMADGKAEINLTYNKTGFESGDARPEFYYDCRDLTGCYNADGELDDDLVEKNAIDYTKQNQEIIYSIAANTSLVVNTQASDVFDTGIKRDVKEMIGIVSDAIAAHDRVKDIEGMLKEEQNSDPARQAILNSYLEAAKKEADYADNNLQKTYSQYIGNFDKYLENVNLAITNVGTTQIRLDLTKNRVENQQTTIEELKSANEDRDISDIIIDYYAAYNAYQASLTSASRVGEQTLLNYL